MCAQLLRQQCSLLVLQTTCQVPIGLSFLDIGQFFDQECIVTSLLDAPSNCWKIQEAMVFETQAIWCEVDLCVNTMQSLASQFSQESSTMVRQTHLGVRHILLPRCDGSPTRIERKLFGSRDNSFLVIVFGTNAKPHDLATHCRKIHVMF